MKLKYLLGSLLIGFCLVGFAANADPVVMLRTTSDKMLLSLKEHHKELQTNKQLVHGIIDKILLPKIDLLSMSRSVVGRTAWINASNNTRNEFMQEFTHYVVDTYSAVFSAYEDQTVVFYPIRGGVNGESRVRVNSMIHQDNGPSIPVTYRLVKEGNDWKVYDFSVDGISMVQSYRSQFADTLAQGGLEMLVQRLKSKRQGG